jgi:hypothetical protein
LTKITPSSRHNNPSANDNNNNNNNVNSYSSSSYDKWLKSFYEDMGWKPLFYSWDKPSATTKAIDRAEKLLNKINISQTLATNRLKSIPQNATIRTEYIKCGKAGCLHETHGPY